MNRETWSAVDRYFSDLIVHEDDALKIALVESTKAGLPEINVSPCQGKFLHMLAKIRGAKNILEIGTLGGYSAIWLARALPPDGKLITLEYKKKHAEVAQQNIARAGVADRVQIMVGKAIDLLPKLESTMQSPFDFIFIDADKVSTPQYFTWSLKLSRPGSVIIVDNVARSGKVIDAKSDDESVQGIRKFNDMLANEPRVTATAIQTVGVKGYDGFVIAIVN